MGSLGPLQGRAQLQQQREFSLQRVSGPTFVVVRRKCLPSFDARTSVCVNRKECSYGGMPVLEASLTRRDESRFRNEQLEVIL